MALQKTCKCGSIIDYYSKGCDKCTKDNKENAKLYNKNVRNSKDNIQFTKFYNSREWKLVREIVRQRDVGLCRLCDDEIVFSDVVHHIIEIKENWDKRLDVDNLICLCHSCHNVIHADIDKGIDTTVKLLKLIREENVKWIRN